MSGPLYGIGDGRCKPTASDVSSCLVCRGPIDGLVVAPQARVTALLFKYSALALGPDILYGLRSNETGIAHPMLPNWNVT